MEGPARVTLAHLDGMVGQTVTFAGRVIGMDMGVMPMLVMGSPGGGEVHVQAQHGVQVSVGDIVEFTARVQGGRQLYQEGPATELPRETNLQLLGEVIDMTWAPELHDLFFPGAQG